MSESAQEAAACDTAVEALPQRAPRAKRRRGNGGAAVDTTVTDSQAPLAAPSPPDAQGGEEPAGATPATRLTLQEYRSEAIAGFNFEYLDHTADVQLHAWGADLREAFENVGLAMFNYMTPLSGISKDESETKVYEAKGHDLQSLLFQFLDELLFTFATEFFVCKELLITTFDRDNWQIVAEGRGEKFSRSRHACGTEVKAITYSAMQINEKEGDAEVFVIVDI